MRKASEWRVAPVLRRKINKSMNSPLIVSPETAHTAQGIEKQLDPELRGPTVALITLDSDMDDNKS